MLFIISLPFFENINKIKLFDATIHNDFDLMIKFYQNMNKNIENLISYNRSKIIYSIGDKLVNRFGYYQFISQIF